MVLTHWISMPRGSVALRQRMMPARMRLLQLGCEYMMILKKEKLIVTIPRPPPPHPRRKENPPTKFWREKEHFFKFGR